MIQFVLEIKPHLESMGEVVRLLEQNAMHALSEPGCEAYQIIRVKNNNGLLYLLEKWATEADFELHRQQAYLLEFKEKAESLLQETYQRLTMEEFDALDIKSN